MLMVLKTLVIRLRVGISNWSEAGYLSPVMMGTENCSFQSSVPSNENSGFDKVTST